MCERSASHESRHSPAPTISVLRGGTPGNVVCGVGSHLNFQEKTVPRGYCRGSWRTSLRADLGVCALLKYVAPPPHTVGASSWRGGVYPPPQQLQCSRYNFYTKSMSERSYVGPPPSSWRYSSFGGVRPPRVEVVQYIEKCTSPRSDVRQLWDVRCGGRCWPGGVPVAVRWFSRPESLSHKSERAPRAPGGGARPRRPATRMIVKARKLG